MSILDIFFPRTCLGCGLSGKYICEKCIAQVGSANTKYFQIGELSSVTSLWKYEGVVRKAILKLKYNFAYDIAEELSQCFIKELKNYKFQIKNYILVPIPLHRTRENWRGFNQTELLGRSISTGLDWNYEENLLTRHLASKQQVGLPKTERLRNISGKFAVNQTTVDRLLTTESSINHQPSIIIFDDVWTTGATMREAALALKQAGFKSIHGLTICG